MTMRKQTYRKPPKPPESGPAGLVHWISMCEEHGKHLYPSRDAARRVARQHHPRKNAYECPDHPRLWHVGALPGAVRQGRYSRSEVYR